MVDAVTEAEMAILNPDGTEHSIAMYDDGQHNDLAANDGIYGATFVPTQSGDYVWRAEVRGEGGCARMCCALLTFYVGAFVFCVKHSRGARSCRAKLRPACRSSARRSTWCAWPQSTPCWRAQVSPVLTAAAGCRWPSTSCCRPPHPRRCRCVLAVIARACRDRRSRVVPHVRRAVDDGGRRCGLGDGHH
jgi:hypothetical protein